MRERQSGARDLEFVGGGASLALLEHRLVRDEQLVAKVRHHLTGWGLGFEGMENDIES